ncbi:MAG: TonB-dependent receptor [Steroidobacteraceae bacterium]|nr:TonB-dependent receptor [Steroidobacteraceae bacterium]
MNRSIRSAGLPSAAAFILLISPWSAFGADGAEAVAIAEATAVGDAASATQLEPLQEVAITGSRIVRKDYEANSPITSVSADAIEATGAVTVEAALNQLPQFAIGANQTNAGFGGTGQASLNLRGLGVTRNLVLLDGRRLQPSDVLGWVDVNTLPPALIGNVEIITGGASAVYGSDAIAGVVNLQVDSRFEGVRFDTQYNVYEENGDGGTLDASITAGGHFANDRGHGILSLSYTDRQDVGYMSREFFRAARGGTDFRLPTGIYRPNVGSPANLPSQVAVDEVFGRYGADAGRVPNTAVLGYNDDGTLFAASNGPFNYRGPDGLLFDTGTQLNNLNQFSRLQVPLTRYSAFGRASYEVAPSVSAFAQVYYTTYDSLVNAEAGNDAFSVPVSNPWIPADLAQLLASRNDPTAPFRFEKRFQEEAGPRNFDRTFDTFQFLAGFEGRIDRIEGSWEVYGSRGNTRKIERNQGSVLVDSLKALLNAPDGGVSLCEGGYNPFGLTQLSADCRNFLVATPISQTDLEQDIVEANLQGRLFALPAGDLRFATGLGYRKNSYTYLPDQDLARGNVVGVFRTGASRGDTDVVEAFAELLVPVVRDVFLAKAIDLDVAYRYSDYNLAGGVDTYKADFSWTLIDPVRLRGGYQHAVRAPSVGELFVAPNVSIPGIGTVASGNGDPCHYQSQARTGPDAAAVRTLCVQQGIAAAAIDNFANPQQEILATTSGNQALAPESGDTYTFGVVWSSPFDGELLSRLQLALDWYDIEIEDVIGTIGAAQVLPKCFNQDGSNPTLAADNFFCSLIARDPATGWFANVNQPTLNLGGYRTTGLDFQVDWSFGLGAIGLDDRFGRIALNSVISYVDRFEVQLQKNSARLDYAGTVGTPSVTLPGSIPSWKAATRLQYDVGNVGLGLKWRYLDGMRNASKVTNPASTVPDVAAFNYFDLYGQWRVSDLLSLRGGVNNATDEAPPIVGTTPGSTQSSTYDIYGRQYYLALQFNF